MQDPKQDSEPDPKPTEKQDPDPDPKKIIPDPQHWAQPQRLITKNVNLFLLTNDFKKK